ncbi:hypothetical protein [Salicola sp. Rm-C-2C1-2]|uniref:hypothetical protein n=1 Tax=Salicola sp. Rm-C-2C1-2 TaxID=3141321 RepID=UPI0032E377D6
MTFQKLSVLAVAVAAAGGLSGCFSSSSSSDSPSGSGTSADTAVVATVDSSFESGEVELIDLTQDELTASGGYHETISDISVRGDRQHYYLTERFQSDQIGKVDLENPSLFVWEYSTVDENDSGSANPRDLVLTDSSKAYLPRYGSERSWIVDVEAQSEDAFKQGELDLSPYTPKNGSVPRVQAGTVVNDQLFLVMQRLASDFSPSNEAYVSAWDTATDEEIETSASASQLKGIQLSARNPQGITYHPETGLVIHGVGARDDQNLGGIDQVNPDTYATTSWVADQDVDSLAVIDEDTLYFTEYNAFKDVSLFRFDPSTPAEDPVLIESFDGVDIRALAAGPSGNLWIADGAADNPGIRILDPESSQQVDFVPTDLLPKQIEFANLSE